MDIPISHLRIFLNGSRTPANQHFTKTSTQFWKKTVEIFVNISLQKSFAHQIKKTVSWRHVISIKMHLQLYNILNRWSMSKLGLDHWVVWIPFLAVRQHHFIIWRNWENKIWLRRNHSKKIKNQVHLCQVHLHSANQ